MKPERILVPLKSPFPYPSPFFVPFLSINHPLFDRNNPRTPPFPLLLAQSLACERVPGHVEAKATIEVFDDVRVGIVEMRGCVG